MANSDDSDDSSSGGGWWRKVASALDPQAAHERAQQIRERSQQAQEDRLRAKGQWFRCSACDWQTTAMWNAKHGGTAPSVCPICLTHADGTPPTEKQVVRVYVAHKDGVGADVDEAFTREAAQMAKAGWLVQSTQYGGLGVAGEGTVAALTFTTSRTRQAAARKPERVTVIYTRN